MKFIPLLLLTLLSHNSLAADEPDELNELMSNWISLESQKGKLQTQWNARSQQLEQKIALFETERESLQIVIDNSQKTGGDVDEHRLSLLQKQQTLESEQALVNSKIQSATNAIRTLVLRLPPPIQDQWQEKMSLLDQADVSDSEKLERLLSLFKMAEDFDKRIALHRTTMELQAADKRTEKVLVTQIYMGISHGWYVSDDGSAYGYGKANALGWTWWHGADASKELGHELEAKDILKVRAALENPTNASYFPLPLKL